jgi:dephospho-CoA kinase
VIGLVGVTGFAGSGKTTAVKHLEKLTGGQVLYLGQTVLDEVGVRGLSQTRENELQVRIDLRRQNGPAALAIPYVDKVAECFANGIPVFVDAIFVREEFDLLKSRVPAAAARLLAIEASFSVRQTRLALRLERKFSAEELQKRDNTERMELRTDALIASADYKISNEQTFEEFYCRLAEFVTRCA